MHGLNVFLDAQGKAHSCLCPERGKKRNLELQVRGISGPWFGVCGALAVVESDTPGHTLLASCGPGWGSRALVISATVRTISVLSVLRCLAAKY